VELAAVAAVILESVIVLARSLVLVQFLGFVLADLSDETIAEWAFNPRMFALSWMSSKPMRFFLDAAA